MTLSTLKIGAVGGSMLPSALMNIVPVAFTDWMLKMNANKPKNNNTTIMPEAILFSFSPFSSILVD